MQANTDAKVERDASCSEAMGAALRPEKRSHVPRPSTCCVVLTVLSILVFAATVTYLSVWDDDKTFTRWTDRFFASEKRLSEGAAKGELTLVNYDLGNWVYFVLLSLVFVVNITIMVPALTVVVRRRCRSVTKKVDIARNLAEKPSVEAIVPCYLPNECEIIEETIWHILKNVESPGDFKLWLVYNTPKDMPDIEGRLMTMSERMDLPHGRRLEVVRADHSKSKAENINLLLPRLTANYTVVYDADHHPDPESLMLMVEKIIRRNLACVQGSTYIRDLSSGILARVIDAEFFVTHFVYFPIMRLLTRNAIFCGSNGLWKTELLQTTDFNPRMQTEDIDVSVRMLLEKHSIDFCPEARSGELAPVSLRALFKQRLRWAIGWDEVSLKLFGKMVKAGAQKSRKAAVAYVCWSRWLMQLVGIVGGLATPLLSFIQRFDPDLCHCGLATQFLQTCMFYFYMILFASCVLEAVFQIRHRGLQSCIQVAFVALFMGVGFLYLIFQALLITVSLFKISTGRVGGWVVTARKSQKSAKETDKAVGRQAAGSEIDTSEECAAARGGQEVSGPVTSV